jgi:hypothetical protein
MNTRILRSGFLIGLVGGGAMALFAMGAMWATGRGFFTVVNLFAHTFWPSAPIDATFAPAAIGLGLVVHVVVSTIVGTTIAWLVDKGQLDAGIVVLVGIGIGTCVWVVQAFAWAAIDADAHQQFTPWILATAHLVFALGAATFLTWMQRDDTAATRTPDVASDPSAPTAAGAAPRPTRSGFVRPVRAMPENAPDLP